jgi:hypothetical protein
VGGLPHLRQPALESHDAFLRSLQLFFVVDQKRSLDAQSVLWGTTAPGFGKSLFGGAAHGPAPHGMDECLNLLDLAAAPGLAGGRNRGKALEPLSYFRKFGRSVHSAISGR